MDISTGHGPDGRDGSILKEPVLTERKHHHHRDTWHGPKVWTTLVKAFGPMDGLDLYLGNLGYGPYMLHCYQCNTVDK